jgi:2-polyprenyl-6-methoxyphenol hydroxylase-like FAD-dependent oxidoreductase
MRILIVGGGIGGMAAAIRLAQGGNGVDLIDVDPEWRVYGAGITITGPTLRAYQRLGLLDDIKREGAVTSGTRLYRFDGTFLQDLDEPALEEGLPATGGIMRPVLHRLMQKHVASVGIEPRLGLTVDRIEQDDAGVDVVFSDGAPGRYDLVVGADGIGSKVRGLTFPDAVAPMATGQACWRVSMRRAPGLDRNEFYMGHDCPVGITACGPDAMYLWMLTPHEPGTWFDEADGHDRLREKIADFGGTVGWVRDTMSASDWVNYRPLSAMIQPEPWATGRVVLLGDAVHATTPHLASGAGMAVEDALVLAEELDAAGSSVEAGLLAYSRRRYPRCRDVVDNSVAIGRLQLDGRPPPELGQKLAASLHALAEEY